MIGITRVVAIAAASLVFAMSAEAQSLDLDAPGRSDAERARDVTFQPADVYAWIGIQPGDVVVDYRAGGGYNTVLLAQWVGPDGIVFSEMDGPRAEAITERFATGDLASVENAIHVPVLASLPDDSLDYFYVSRNYHDLPQQFVAGFFRQVKRVLKPGGILAVIDIQAAEGRDIDAHRIHQDVVISEATEAGLELIDSSDLLANPDDDHVGPDWGERETLDQFLLKFRWSGEEAAESR